jgi:transposase
VHAAEQLRPDVAALRQGWLFWRPQLDGRKLAFLDEFGASTKLARLYGRAFRGQRVIDYVPHGHWKTTTFVGALRLSGFTAPTVIDGPMNGETFRCYVEQQLAPTLAEGDMLIMDNLPAHKVAGVREAVERVGAQLVYLPPYSPDLNPIELAFAKLKSLMRSAAERTVEGLERRIGQLLDLFDSSECHHYFRHCGYEVR